MVPTLAPAINPTPEPIADDMNPSHGPIKIQVANMAKGAKVMVESGGGMGIAIMVVTAIRAAMIAVRASLTAGRW